MLLFFSFLMFSFNFHASLSTLHKLLHSIKCTHNLFATINCRMLIDFWQNTGIAVSDDCKMAFCVDGRKSTAKCTTSTIRCCRLWTTSRATQKCTAATRWEHISSHQPSHRPASKATASSAGRTFSSVSHMSFSTKKRLAPTTHTVQSRTNQSKLHY